MSLAHDIIYAAHARGTHHKLALDALEHLSGADAAGWRRLLMKHAAILVSGAKAPDAEFKDFTNHVLHVPSQVPTSDLKNSAGMRCLPWLLGSPLPVVTELRFSRGERRTGRGRAVSRRPSQPAGVRESTREDVEGCVRHLWLPVDHVHQRTSLVPQRAIEL